MRPILLAAALPFALAACNQQAGDAPPAPAASESPIPVEPDGGIGDGATPLPAPGEDAGEPSPAPQGAIPMALQGRWGMVPADCTSTRGDAKGLLTVGPRTLTFYESVGRLDAAKERSENRLRADYAFTGEGMSWTRDVTLSVSEDAKTLTRLDRGGDQPGGPFTYTRCG